VVWDPSQFDVILCVLAFGAPLGPAFLVLAIALMRGGDLRR
jgi:hypothetical protein